MEIERPTFKQAFRFWLLLGFINFGGPTGQIALMYSELVEKRKWISETRFLHALNFCMLLPGPEAIQLAIYMGWLWHGIAGGIVAGLFFLLPSVFILLGLSYIYVVYGTVPLIASIFYGLKPAVIAIVFFAAMRIGNKVLKNSALGIIALFSFMAIFFLKLPFPLIIFLAALAGWVGGHFWKETFYVLKPFKEGTEEEGRPPSVKKSLAYGVLFLILWWLPVLGLGFWQGWSHVHFQMGLFLSKAALVTFGGAYSVLSYVAQQSVENYHWLEPGQMIDGLGLAETTPGPLIIVLQFVGFLGGWNFPEGLAPLTSAILGALIATWVTFVPCFAWIFLGAPFIEKLRGHVGLMTTLTAVTAAVVGVILNLAVWFALQVIFPAKGGVEWFALMLSLVAFFGMWKWGWGIIPVILGSGLVGIVYNYF